jgi:malic enzyme
MDPEAIRIRAPRISAGMKIAAHAPVAAVLDPAPEQVLPSPQDPAVASLVARAVASAANH